MNNKIVLSVLFAATFSMSISFNHPAYAGFTCNPHSHYAPHDQSQCACDPGFVQNGLSDTGHVTLEPICIAPVGGMGIPIDSTALLLAGVQGSALWMIPALVIAGAGIGLASYKKSKKKQD